MRQLIIAVATIGFAASLATAGPVGATEITVHKTPWCGCCEGWIKHLEDNGFTVTAQDHEDTDPIKAELGVPARLQSCHTGVVGGYAIEGHVPAGDIKRLLAERPEAVGISAPGMPAGSPGMETSGASDAYQVILFGKQGMSVWAEH